MNKNKFEEGETCDDSTVDPDIALSYIDEKLQDVLGHFQKDFEDGVSSENLGSKFGGYGSFLPTYQRSPSWTCRKTPPDAYNNNGSISPSSLRPEGGRRPSSASSSASLSGRPLASSAYSSTIVPTLKAPAANGKTNSALQPAQDEDSTSRSELVKKPTNLSDKKAPKLHARIGIKKFSTQKKAEIYSGLGLDVSPSSSLDDSPISSEGLSHDLKDSRYESPTSILQIMTSYPMHDGLLLSPLPDDLLCLTEKGKVWGGFGSECMIQESLETSVTLVNGAHYANRRSSEARKWKSYNKDVLGTGYGSDNQNGSTVQSKELDVKVITCEELVSEALKLPLLSNPNHNVADPLKDAGRVSESPRTTVRDRAAECSSYKAGSQESRSPEMLKVSDAVSNKSLVEHNCLTKERVNVGKTEKPCSSGEYPILASNEPTSLDALHASQDNWDHSVQGIDSSGRKRYGSKGLSSGTKEDGSQSSNYVMMNHQENPNCRSSSGTSRSLDKTCNQHTGVPNSSVVEKRRHKNKEKKISHDNHSDGGTKDANTRNTSEVESDVSSKKIMRDDAHDDENQTFCPVVENSGWSSSSNMPGMIRDKCKNRDSEDDSKKDLVSAKNPEAHISDVSTHKGKCDNNDSPIKRKGRELRDSLTCNPQDSMEKICDDISRKEKVARISLSDRKDTSASKGSAGTGQVKKEQQAGQDLDSTLSLLSVKAADSSQKDLCNSRPSVAPSSAFPTSSPKRSSDGENDGFSNKSSMVKKDNACNGKSYDLLSEAELEEKDVHRESGKKVKAKATVSGYATQQDTDVSADPLRQASQFACKTGNSDQGSDKERKNDHQFQNTGSVSNRKRGSSSRRKEKNRAPKSDSDQCKTKDTDILNLSSDQMPINEEKTAPGKNKSQGKSVVGSDRLKKSSKKDPSGKLLEKNVKGDNESRFVHRDDAEVRSDVVARLDKRQATLPERDDQRSSKVISNKSEQINVSSKSPLTRDQNETAVFKEPVPGSERENGNAFERERSNTSRQGKKAKSHHGNLPNNTANKVRDQDVPSPVRKDSSSQAATNAIKEATNLKHLADRLKNSGSSESTGIYFQAALKFLHGASLLELDSSKHGEQNQSRSIYSSTAKLCQFCGHEYEKLRDMAAAALAYKCMEVAYMRVIYSSQSDANRYRNELQTALQIFPPGESPFSSISDVDNLNNPTIVDMAASAKVVGSPQVAGTHVISAGNGSSFTQLINLAQAVNFAMEASRKSRVAFAAVYPGPGDSQCKEGALSVKKALDFNFQDVDGLLRLVRVAMEAISH
ncbi:uncharacterized protein LOC107022011 isoform X1 [Solanum pennellii]|uniref:Uncharacterized protein LOC107022011 isoform X1 n=1 Tax=Solanum pennellii TaxID=28526 RepID=A0ABM1GZJ7_SOLPN|nr:uncharacterized protein LOC107022011 isoform X1 [Solanum pennellii]XP_015078198.1 uncharacterized protein LOC107022011 isoform X1 [Solanum pennellii]